MGELNLSPRKGVASLQRSLIMMDVKLLMISILVIISNHLFATTFIYLPLEKQLQESDGVIHGRYLGQDYKRNRSGDVLTTAKFELIDFAGIDRSRALNPNSFVVSYPGGKWQGMVYKVHGTPSFRMQEEVILFVKEIGDGFMLTNLGMAKYNIFTADHKKYLKSALFPNHPKLSKIDFNSFQGLLEHRFGEPLTPPNTDKLVDRVDRKGHRAGKYIASNSKQSGGRSPASMNGDGSRSNEQKTSVVWLIIILALLGGGASLFLARR
jgi:hypothetical protein